MSLTDHKLYWDRYEYKDVKLFIEGCHINGATSSSLYPRLPDSGLQGLKVSSLPEAQDCFGNGPLWRELAMKLFQTLPTLKC